MESGPFRDVFPIENEIFHCSSYYATLELDGYLRNVWYLRVERPTYYTYTTEVVHMAPQKNGGTGRRSFPIGNFSGAM